MEAKVADDKTKPTAPDLSHGISLADLPDGRMLIGHVESEEILLVRVGDEVFAVSPHCTHYHGPLAEGLVIETALRCPWHHACFDLRTGNALRAPANRSYRMLERRAARGEADHSPVGH
jgi:nitrite reductase/ring-hydroxylating ferredoxin subunit